MKNAEAKIVLLEEEKKAEILQLKQVKEAEIALLKKENTDLKAQHERVKKIAKKYKGCDEENKTRISELSKALAGYRE